MRLIHARALWGVEGKWEDALPKFKEQGFEAIETPTQFLNEVDGARFREHLAMHGMRALPLQFAGGKTVTEIVTEFRRVAADAGRYNPLMMNIHSGLDAMSFTDMVALYQEFAQIEKDLPFQVCHETHRGRCFYNPWITRDVLEKVPAIKLTADFSHWTVVAERMVLDDDADLLRFIADRVLHIHARVGHGEGPQVPDPRAPEWQFAVDAFEKWWDVVWDSQQRRGFSTTTMTPEFGPPHYLWTIPHTNMPVANLWDICTWQAKRQGERFAKRIDSAKG